MERYRLSLASRERIALAVVVAIFLFLTGGLVKLQIVEHAEFARQSEENRIRVVPIVPRRGIVYDREGRVIIDNRPSYTVSVVPAEEVDGVTVPNLSEIIGLDTLEIRKRITRNMVSRYQPSPVKQDIPFEVVAMLEEQSARFPGVSYTMERVRMYTDSIGSESFTGYVGEVSKEEMGRRNTRKLRLGSMIGKKGLEKQYDELLRGTEGTEYIEVFASGQVLGPYESKQAEPAVPGTDLTLTIDYDLQRTAVEALTEHCCGAVVAMDPRNGEVLVMTSYPTYDANMFSSVIPDSAWKALQADTNNPLINRPLTGQYPPGSTFKIVTIGAGLEEAAITPNSTFQPCNGGYQFGNRFFRCWKPEGHGIVNAAHSLEVSCDTYLYQLGLKLGVDKLSEYMGKCGFGRPTGIDLPVEVAGLNPDSRYYNERYGRRGWTRALVLNNSIGQGEILSTPLQLAQLFCGVANDGKVFKPHIVKAMSHPSGDVITTTPTVSFELPFSRSTLDLLMEGIRLVVEGEDGTARSLRNKHYSIGGKTGTAQNPHGENHSLFVGVAPLENPEIVVCAIVENAGDGSEFAAPLVGKVIDRYMQKHYPYEPLAVSEPVESIEEESDAAIR